MRGSPSAVRLPFAEIVKLSLYVSGWKQFIKVHTAAADKDFKGSIQTRRRTRTDINMLIIHLHTYSSFLQLSQIIGTLQFLKEVVLLQFCRNC